MPAPVSPKKKSKKKKEKSGADSLPLASAASAPPQPVPVAAVPAVDAMPSPPPPPPPPKKKKKKKKKKKASNSVAGPPQEEAAAIAPLAAPLPRVPRVPVAPPTPAASARAEAPASPAEEDDDAFVPPPPPKRKATPMKAVAAPAPSRSKKTAKKNSVADDYDGWSTDEDDSVGGGAPPPGKSPSPAPAPPTPRVKMPTKRNLRRMSCFLVSSADGLKSAGDLNMNEDAKRLEVVNIILENFDEIDDDGSGSISVDELLAGLAFVKGVDRPLVKAIVATLDADGNGEIEKHELTDEKKRLTNIVTLTKTQGAGIGGSPPRRSMSPPLKRLGSVSPLPPGPLPPGPRPPGRAKGRGGPLPPSPQSKASPGAAKARKRRVRRLSVLAGIDSSGDRYSMIRSIVDSFGSVSNGADSLTKDQFRMCLPIETGEDEADKLFREIDKDGSGTVEFFELQAELKRMKGTGDTVGAEKKKLSTFQKMQLDAKKKAEMDAGGPSPIEGLSEEGAKKEAAKRNKQVKDKMLSLRANLGWDDDHSASDDGGWDDSDDFGFS